MMHGAMNIKKTSTLFIVEYNQSKLKVSLCTPWRRKGEQRDLTHVSGNFTFWTFYTQQRTPGTHWLGGWVHCRASLDVLEKNKIPHYVITLYYIPLILNFLMHFPFQTFVIYFVSILPVAYCFQSRTTLFPT